MDLLWQTGQPCSNLRWHRRVVPERLLQIVKKAR
jgi:hypothetical protein